MSRGKTGQRGFALLIVLWTLGLLALLGTQLLATARQDTQLARNLLDAAELEAAANGAVQQAIFANLDTSNKHWDADSVTRMIRVGRVPVAVRLDDEAEKVNPNIASGALLQALIAALGADRVTAARVAASIDGVAPGVRSGWPCGRGHRSLCCSAARIRSTRNALHQPG